MHELVHHKEEPTTMAGAEECLPPCPIFHGEFLFPVEQVQGYGVLDERKRVFALNLLRGCSKREAARLAGCSEKSADRQAQKWANSVQVRTFLNQAWAKSGANAESFIARIAERAARYHEMVRSLPEGSKAWQFAVKSAREEDALLASIHGKLSVQVNVAGRVEHSHVMDLLPMELREVYTKSAGGVHARN